MKVFDGTITSSPAPMSQPPSSRRVIAFTLPGEGGPAWIGIDPVTHLPRFTRWVSSHANLGDLTTTAWFSGYLPFDGVQLPMEPSA